MFYHFNCLLMHAVTIRTLDTHHFGIQFFANKIFTHQPLTAHKYHRYANLALQLELI